MKRRRLKRSVVNVCIISVVSVLVISLATSYFLNKIEKNYYNDDYVVNGLEEEENLPVMQNDDIPKYAYKPFLMEDVYVKIDYYSMKDDSKNRENSLFFYKNTYMENTGILYESDKAFEVISVLDGIIEKVYEDEILGKVVEIKHNNKLSTIYYSVNDIRVEEGDIIAQGEVIATSGSNNLDDGENQLLFEVYFDGNVIDPEILYSTEISEFE